VRLSCGRHGGLTGTLAQYSSDYSALRGRVAAHGDSALRDEDAGFLYLLDRMKTPQSTTGGNAYV